MLKYKNIGTVVISVDLHNDYHIIAMANWDKENNYYKATLYIKREDVDILDLIEEQENVIFESDMKSIKTDIAEHITKFSSEGFFDSYIHRYEYERRCFDKGNEFFELERLGGANVS